MTEGRRKSKLPVPTASEAVESARKRAPGHLDAAGRAAWKVIVAGASLLAPVDEMAATRFCEMVDERGALRRAVGDDLTLAEPIVSPRGDVVGERLVAHPLLRELRAIDRALAAEQAALGLTPASRARLGLAVTSAQRAQAEADALVDRMYRRDPDD